MERERRRKYIYEVMKRSLFRISFSFGFHIQYVGMFCLEQVNDRQPLQANCIQSVPVAPGVTGGWSRQQMSLEKLFFAPSLF